MSINMWQIKVFRVMMTTGSISSAAGMLHAKVEAEAERQFREVEPLYADV